MAVVLEFKAPARRRSRLRKLRQASGLTRAQLAAVIGSEKVSRPQLGIRRVADV